MNPAFSVIFFTVTAGAGYGLMILLALSRIAGLAPGITPGQMLAFGLVGLLLVSAGLVSSTFHLANPKNAWRSFTRFKTSWLSREAVFAVLFYPVSLLWLVLEWSGGGAGASLMAAITAALAVVVLICTAMIYASLKTIRQWHTPLTPVNFLMLSLLVGALIFAMLNAQQGMPVAQILPIVLAVLVLAAFVKITYFFWIGQPAGPTINTALGFTRATVRLLDVGHASDTFLTREFGFQVDRVRLMWLRIATVVLGFVIPLLMVSGALGQPGFALLLVAAVSAYAGVFIERWLFFAEARHVVNLYHGAQRT